MSRVLVTGGAGFIGSHVVDSLIEAGHEVVVVDDLSRGRRRNVNPKARFYRIDIRKEELASIFAHERPEYVSHHAAHVDLRHSLEDPLHDASANVLGSINLLECCRRHEVSKIIYASSVAIYGEPEQLPCNEEHPIRPSSPYGASKYAVELYLYLYRENYGLDYTILRYPNVYGPRQDPLGEAGVVAIFSLQMLLGEEVTINGSGDQERDFVYVEDCVKANLLSMEKGNGKVYNLGTGKGTSINRLLEEMMREIGPFRYAREDLPVSSFSREELLERLLEEAPVEIGGVRVAGVGNTDGVKYHLQDESWLLIRPSGTEPLLRIYAEGRSWDQVKRLLAEGRSLAGL